MGFHESTNGPSKTWAKFAQGKICLSSREPRDGYTERVNKAGNTVYEQYHDAFTGYLQDVTATDEGDYGRQWIFTMQDEGRQFAFATGYSTRYAKSMLNALCNPALDYNAKMTLKPYAFENDQGKKIVGVTIYQGEKITGAYDKTTLPPLREVKVKGETMWDDTEVMEFFEAKLSEVIKPRLNGAVNDTAPATAEAGVDNDGSLPF